MSTFRPEQTHDELDERKRELHRLTFYPIGNADSCLIELDNGRLLLCDYAHCKDGEDEDDPHIDLAATLREKLNGKELDVLMITHADRDHFRGMSEIFYLEHSKDHQSSDRIKVKELWVPAAVIIDDALGEGEARLLQDEARSRLLENRSIRVFSRPERLDAWLEERESDLTDPDLVIDAGNCVPGFTLEADGLEVFVHSPFAAECDEEEIKRNDAAFVFQATFEYGEEKTRLLWTSDVPHAILTKIVEITQAHGNEERLTWDVVKVPHHCSYLSLSSERGEDVTEPVEEVEWLFDRGSEGCILVSTSEEVPARGSDRELPHRQAANYYKRVAADARGEFRVTMEYPSKARPKPMVIQIGTDRAELEKEDSKGAPAVIGRDAPRAG